MAKIEQLSPLLADMIAAGEVVERPASVVKELLENSIDAGGTQLTVEIRSGGMSFIRVTDNGCGMSKEDAQTAFLRHATSKLHTPRDLEAIGTLGFRGEALAAISAVSRVELITKEQDSSEGTKVLVSAGKIDACLPVGCPDGTTFIVRDLFFNTPARLKFVKNDRSEGSAVSAVVLRIALSHPEVSIKYIREGVEECHTPGDGNLESCIYSILGKDFASGMLPAQFDDGKIKVTGFVSSPGSARGNRTRQYFFVNGRFVASKTLQAALERGYGNNLFVGKFPACILHIEISYGAVDVNVHPTKTEVKFSDSNAVFGAVYSAVQYAIENEHRLTLSNDVSVPLTTSKPEADEKSKEPSYAASYRPVEKNDAFSSPKPSYHNGYAYGYSGSSHGKNSTNVYKSFIETKRDADYVRDYAQNTYTPSYASKHEDESDGQISIELPKTAFVEASGSAVKADDFTIVGEVLNTYIVVEQNGSVIFIDKHAAHERMIFDSLRENTEKPMVQIALSPIICELSSDDMSVLLDNAEELNKLGFDIDRFSDRTVAVRQLPCDVDTGDVKSMLEELCDALSSGDNLSLAQRQDDILHIVACKAAIKAGKKSDMRELIGLVRRVLREDVRYCPHGRPVCISFSKYDLDSKFNRA